MKAIRVVVDVERETMTIVDLARTDVVTAAPDASCVELAEQMTADHVGSVVVVDGDAPIGMVTDRDLTTRVIAPEVDPTTTTARDVMTEHPATVSVDAGVFEVCAAMREANVRRMPVVDGESLAGIVTLDDLAVVLTDELGDLARVIQSESPPY